MDSPFETNEEKQSSLCDIFTLLVICHTMSSLSDKNSDVALFHFEFTEPDPDFLTLTHSFPYELCPFPSLKLIDAQDKSYI